MSDLVTEHARLGLPAGPLLRRVELFLDGNGTYHLDQHCGPASAVGETSWQESLQTACLFCYPSLPTPLAEYQRILTLTVYTDRSVEEVLALLPESDLSRPDPADSALRLPLGPGDTWASSWWIHLEGQRQRLILERTQRTLTLPDTWRHPTTRTHSDSLFKATAPTWLHSAHGVEVGDEEWSTLDQCLETGILARLLDVQSRLAPGLPWGPGQPCPSFDEWCQRRWFALHELPTLLPETHPAVIDTVSGQFLGPTPALRPHPSSSPTPHPRSAPDFSAAVTAGLAFAEQAYREATLTETHSVWNVAYTPSAESVYLLRHTTHQLGSNTRMVRAPRGYLTALQTRLAQRHSAAPSSQFDCLADLGEADVFDDDLLLEVAMRVAATTQAHPRSPQSTAMQVARATLT